MEYTTCNNICQRYINGIDAKEVNTFSCVSRITYTYCQPSGKEDLQWLDMERLIMFLIIGINQVHGNQDKEFFEDDIFVTSNETSYSDIPKSCHLFGATLLKNVLFQNIKLNISYNGQLWIGAKADFRRNIKPIGHNESCISNGNDSISLDECSSKCKESFLHNDKYCQCADNDSEDKINKNFKIAESTMRQQNMDCVIYRRVNLNEKPTCDTLTKQNGHWYFGSEICNKKTNYSYICVKDNYSQNFSNNLLTWKQAYIECKSKGHDLIQTTKPFWKQYKEPNTLKFWVDFSGLMLIEFRWGTVADDEACVAVNTSLKGSLSLVPVSCTEKMPALCHSVKWLERTNRKTLHNGENVLSSFSFAGGVFGIVFLLLAALIYKCKYRRDTKLIHTENFITRHTDDDPIPLDDAKKSNHQNGYD